MNLAKHIASHMYIETDEYTESCDCGWHESDSSPQTSHAAHVAETWQEARTVRTPDAYYALPDGAIIRDALGRVHERFECDPILPDLILWNPEEDQ